MARSRFIAAALVLCLGVAGYWIAQYHANDKTHRAVIRQVEEQVDYAHLDVEHGFRYYFFGQPRYVGKPLAILVNKGYVSGYDSDLRDPRWVCYRLFPVKDAKTWPRPGVFSHDPRVPNSPDHAAYTNSGYDRGHMAPNAAIATHYGREAQIETFLTTNICPQLPGLNRQPWEAFERLESDTYAQEFDSLWVVTGPIFEDPEIELMSGVRVPSAFYKILVAVKDGRPMMLAVVMPQELHDKQSLDHLVTTVRDIEVRTGLDFFHDLPDDVENALENSKPSESWDYHRELLPRFPSGDQPIHVRPSNN